MENTILNLKKSCSPGYDNISSDLLIYCCPIVSEHLSRIFNSIVCTSVYPQALKLSKIIPVPKSRSSNTVESYRPIALLSIIDKVFEKIIHSQLMEYFQSEMLLYNTVQQHFSHTNETIYI